MYARVTTTQVLPGKADEANRIFRDSVVRAAKEQKGFKGCYLLVDSSTGKGVSIAFWDTEADLVASEASGYFREQLAKFATLFAAPPTTERYEVVVQA